MPYLVGFQATHFWNPWSILINPRYILFLVPKILLKTPSTYCGCLRALAKIEKSFLWKQKPNFIEKTTFYLIQWEYPNSGSVISEIWPSCFEMGVNVTPPACGRRGTLTPHFSPYRVIFSDMSSPESGYCSNNYIVQHCHWYDIFVYFRNNFWT